MTTPQARTKQLASLTGLVLVGVIVIGAFVGSNAVAEDLTPKAYKALVESGLSNVRVDFDGREAKLSNGSREELARAEKIVEGVGGVRSAAIDTDRRSTLPTPPTMSLSLTRDGASLSGVVPNAEIAARLKEVAEDTFGTVTGGLKVDSLVGTADWLVTMPKLIPNVAGVSDLALSVDGDSLAIGGSLGSQASIDALTELVEPSLGDLSLDNTLKVDPGVLSAEDTQAIKAASVYFARGSSVIDGNGRAALEAIVDVLERNTGLKLEIGGHAGPSDPIRGRVLSGERVAAVKDYLVASGIDAARLSTRSYGSDPESDGDAFAEQYRRVDFIVKGN